MSDTLAGSILPFLQLANRLKTVRRQGWLDRGVDDPESVADHSWSVALLGWLLAAGRPGLDRDRVLLLGLVHDLPEAVVGDATPFDHLRDESGNIPIEHFTTPPEYLAESRAAKQQRETDGIRELVAPLPDDLAAGIRSAWREYDQGRTAEARFVKQIDKLETVLQALLYQDDQPDLTIDSFIQGADRDIRDSLVRQLFEGLLDNGNDS
jgi:putative hydrolase of HD superfamily